MFNVYCMLKVCSEEYYYNCTSEINMCMFSMGYVSMFMFLLQNILSFFPPQQCSALHIHLVHKNNVCGNPSCESFNSTLLKPHSKNNCFARSTPHAAPKPQPSGSLSETGIQWNSEIVYTVELAAPLSTIFE